MGQHFKLAATGLSKSLIEILTRMPLAGGPEMHEIESFI